MNVFDGVLTSTNVYAGNPILPQCIYF